MKGLVIALACVGVVFIIDALLRGSLLRYRLAGVATGAVLLLPAALVGVFRGKGIAVLRKCVFAAVPALLLVVVLELLLWLCGAGNANRLRVIPDARLGHVLEPGYGIADANGFRNPAAVEHADVLFVGDSMTYGFGVALAASFPYAYAAAQGRSVYSMALGGYGPVQYREVVRSGLRLEPSDVVVGFYFGNDLQDAFTHAYLPVATDLRKSDIRYPAWTGLASMQDKPAPNLAIGAVEAVAKLSRLAELTIGSVSSLLRDSGGAWDDEPGAPRWTDGSIATLLTPAYRLWGVKPQDPVVADGLRIATRCLQDIAADCKAAGARPVLVPIHTKEFCYQELAARRGAPRKDLRALHRAEARVAQSVTAAARAAGFTVVDPTRLLVAGLASDHALWPHGSDGHPNAAGHAVIAAGLAQALRAR